jgi:ATP-binding protein involved in chromosome partitioning
VDLGCERHDAVAQDWPQEMALDLFEALTASEQGLSIATVAYPAQVSLAQISFKTGANMTNEQDKLVDLIGINIEVGWNCDFRCEDCYRFFECPSPHKQEFYHSSRVEDIAKNLSNIRHIIVVMSGKGGVGKSIISANLAVALANRGYSVAVMDSDLCGPSIPSILGLDGGRLKSGPGGIVPPQGPLGIKIVSMDFLLSDNDPVTWLSDLKRSAQEQLLANTDYGYLDYLIIDMPPGTGSEVVNLLKYLSRISGAIIVTMPSDIAGQVVHRCISLCQRAKAPIIGLIENMSGFVCPHCGETYMIEHGFGDILAQKEGGPLLGKIARDPLIVNAADKGRSFLLEYPDSESSKNFLSIVSRIEEKVGGKKQKGLAKMRQEPEESQLSEILEINVDHSCYGKSCYNCSRYFQCTYPKKYELYDDISFRGIEEAMSGIKHKIAVMSCKGGVGKSTFAANLAAALAQRGKTTAILDCDFHGPCIPKILGVEGKGLKIGKKGIVPVSGPSKIGVISMAFLLQLDEAVTWFDSLKKVTVEQLLRGGCYGSLDYLIIDLPPGTGGEPYALLQYTPDLDGALIITLPSENPQAVARRSIGLCRQARVPVLGIVENMSRFICSNCNNISKMCGAKKARDLAHKIGVPFLGDIPLDNNIFESCVMRECHL